jgi:hypothetical protein
VEPESGGEPTVDNDVRVSESSASATLHSDAPIVIWSLYLAQSIAQVIHKVVRVVVLVLAVLGIPIPAAFSSALPRKRTKGEERASFSRSPTMPR